MKLHEKLFQLRKKNGFTQQELAEKLNVTRQAVSRWEMNSSIPSTEKLILISKLYGINIDYLISEDEEDNFLKSHKKTKNIFKYVYLTVIIFLIGALFMFLFTDTFKHVVVSFWFLFLSFTLLVLVGGLIYLYINKRNIK
ncbi:MAG: hypothetical protein CSB16_02515 [Clostridiales bacterium]|nr:MAG: hypothetical protein CSB16_02515 [Clostridiales bacterium]